MIENSLLSPTQHQGFSISSINERTFYLGNIYTGLHDGRIVKVTPGGQLVEVIRTGESIPECGKCFLSIKRFA